MNATTKDALAEVNDALFALPTDDDPQDAVEAWYERCRRALGRAIAEAELDGRDREVDLLRDMDRHLEDCYDTGDAAPDSLWARDVWHLFYVKRNRLIAVEGDE